MKRRLVFAVMLPFGQTIRGALELAKCGPVTDELTLRELEAKAPIIEADGEPVPSSRRVA